MRNTKKIYETKEENIQEEHICNGQCVLQIFNNKKSKIPVLAPNKYDNKQNNTILNIPDLCEQDDNVKPFEYCEFPKNRLFKKVNFKVNSGPLPDDIL